MSDLAYALARLRRMTVTEWTHGILGCALIAGMLWMMLAGTP